MPWIHHPARRHHPHHFAYEVIAILVLTTAFILLTPTARPYLFF